MSEYVEPKHPALDPESDVLNYYRSIPGADAFGRLTREAAAEALGCAPSTLANWTVQGVGPKSFKARPGRRVYYMADEIRRFALGLK